jgi:hypothetical protein
VCVLCASDVLAAQELLDRVLARIGAEAITLTDVRAAVGLGLVEVVPGEDAQRAALEQTIERRLLLDEAARFPPPEPGSSEIAAEVAAMKMRAGAALEQLMASTGLDEADLETLARQTLRIRGYLAQRFGTTAQVTEDEVRQYYTDHPSEFMRAGELIPFGQASSIARERASAARLRTIIDDWVDGLRVRANVVIVGGGR